MVSVFDCVIRDVSEIAVGVQLPGNVPEVIISRKDYLKAVATSNTAQEFHEAIQAAKTVNVGGNK